RSVGNLTAVEFFSGIMVLDNATVVGGPRLERGTDQMKHEVFFKLDSYVGEGQKNDQIAPFHAAFKTAFAIVPRSIFFLTDGHFAPQLFDAVKSLNTGNVCVNTVAFVNHEPKYEKQLQQLAEKNHGKYYFVSAEEAEGKPRK